MLNKRGDSGYPAYVIPMLGLLALIFIVFGFLFFGLGVAKSSPLQTDMSVSSSSLNLINILRTEVPYGSSSISIGDYLSIASSDLSVRNDLSEKIEKLVNKLPVPDNSQVYWNFVAVNSEDKIIGLGDKTVGGNDYFVQKMFIPTKNKELISVSLSLNCFGCSNNVLEGFG